MSDKYDPHTWLRKIEAETDELLSMLGDGWERASRVSLRTARGAYIAMMAGEVTFPVADGRRVSVDIRDMSIEDIAAVVKAAHL